MYFDMIMIGVKILLYEINKKILFYVIIVRGKEKNVLIFLLNLVNDIIFKRNFNYEGRLKMGILEIFKYYVVYS